MQPYLHICGEDVSGFELVTSRSLGAALPLSKGLPLKPKTFIWPTYLTNIKTTPYTCTDDFMPCGKSCIFLNSVSLD